MQKKMTIEYLPISSLHEYPHNAKKHPDEQIEHIANSIREFGWQQPLVVDKNDVLVIGHGRLLAAKKLGLKTVPVIKAEDLTDEQIRALRLADNKTNESEWDIDLLDGELDDIFDIDMEQFGFVLPDFVEPTEVVEDEVPDDAESRCKLGDVWQLGEHRLVCGDSTDPAVIDRLMDGVKADIAITSPPYNADHMDVPKSKERGGGKQKSTEKKYLADNDKRTNDEYFDFLCANIDILLVNASEVFYNIGVGSGSKIAIARILNHYQ